MSASGSNETTTIGGRYDFNAPAEVVFGVLTDAPGRATDEPDLGGVVRPGFALFVRFWATDERDVPGRTCPTR